MSPTHHHHRDRTPHRISSALLLLLLLTPLKGWAHGGHGDEFQGGQTSAAPGEIAVDAVTAQRMGLKVQPVSRQQLAFGITATGQIESLPNQQVEVTTPIRGTVTQLLVQPGDQVSAGEAVAIMTSPELAELRTTALDRKSEAIASVQQATADLQLAQKNYKQQQRIAAAEVAQARSQLNFAQERFDKDRELAVSGAIPRRTFLESETKLAEAKASLTKSESRLEVSEAAAQLQRAESAVQVARSRMSLSQDTYRNRLRQLGAIANENGTLTIAAPIAGTVADREITVGESGQDAGKKVMTIINGSSVQVSANIYEKDLDLIQTGQRVQMKVASLRDRTFQGRISVVGAVVEGATRVVPVKAQLDNPNGVLKPGMFAELEVLTDRTTVAVMAIPKTAVVETNDKKQVVFVQNGSAFQSTEVHLGRTSGDWVEVKSGLFDGDEIVTQRASQLYAQSLRGGGAKAPNEQDETLPISPSNQNSGLPWWIVLPTGGAIAAGMFWAGTFWASRRSRQSLAPKPDETGYEIEQSNGDGAKPGISHSFSEGLPERQRD
ncbi:MAG: efflux RND transporter periplasmic adaptor subunit [Leptolyngbya sp.]|nr:MAG: efflux RND transporter periplasmic adaptor subunit [Leptolyngbya sp.]